MITYKDKETKSTNTQCGAGESRVLSCVLVVLLSRTFHYQPSRKGLQWWSPSCSWWCWSTPPRQTLSSVLTTKLPSRSENISLSLLKCIKSWDCSQNYKDIVIFKELLAVPLIETIRPFIKTRNIWYVPGASIYMRKEENNNIWQETSPLMSDSSLLSSLTLGVLRREVGASVGTLVIEDLTTTGITYCRIDTENVVSRYLESSYRAKHLLRCFNIKLFSLNTNTKLQVFQNLCHINEWPRDW